MNDPSMGHSSARHLPGCDRHRGHPRMDSNQSALRSEIAKTHIFSRYVEGACRLNDRSPFHFLLSDSPVRQGNGRSPDGERSRQCSSLFHPHRRQVVAHALHVYARDAGRVLTGRGNAGRKPHRSCAEDERRREAVIFREGRAAGPELPHRDLPPPKSLEKKQ